MHTEKLLNCTNSRGKSIQLRKIEEAGEVYFIIDGINGSFTEDDYEAVLDVFKDEISLLF